MLSIDANLLLHCYSEASPHHAAAKQFIEAASSREDVAVSEFVLTEFYLLLRNPVVLAHPLTAPEAGASSKPVAYPSLVTGIASVQPLDEGAQDLSGMRKNACQLGVMAMDRVIDMIHRNERGLPSLPHLFMAEGSWVEGQTLRPFTAAPIPAFALGDTGKSTV